MAPLTAKQVYEGSSGEATRQYYAALGKHGAIGLVAMNLFRASKCSARAKVYRGGVKGKGSFRGMAYQRKEWSLAQLCEVLNLTAAQLNIIWGWKHDPFTPGFEWVLYIDLPVKTATAACDMSAAALESGAAMEITYSQVSFHAPKRGVGPDYGGQWDKSGRSDERIIQFCDSIMERALSL